MYCHAMFTKHRHALINASHNALVNYQFVSNLATGRISHLIFANIMASDTIGKVILAIYRFPQLIQNKTLTEILTIIISDSTILNDVAQASGVANNTITEAVKLYLSVVEYLASLSTAPKNSTNVTSNSTQDDDCLAASREGDFTTLCLLPSFFIILLFSLLTRRQNPKKRCGIFWKRPGLCIPLNLVDSYENRLGYAAAFGVTVTKCLLILLLSDYEDIFSSDIIRVQKDPSNPGWLGVFWKMLAMVIIGLAYYPFFACMSTEYVVLGGIIGFCYSSVWLFMSVGYALQCPNYFVTLVYPGDSFAFALPVYICFIVLAFTYFINMVKSIWNFVRRFQATKKLNYEEELWKTTYKYKYVKKLLQPVPKECRGTTAVAKIKAKIYKWKPEFKYSTRVVCTYAVILLMLYQIGVGLVVAAGLLYVSSLVLISAYTAELLALGISTSLMYYWVFIGYVAWFVALAISSIYSLVLIANMLSWYRGHLARLQRGDKSFLPVEALQKSPSSITVSTLKYSGYQVAYAAWSYIILHILLFVIGTVIGIQIIHPMIRGQFDSFLWGQILNIWPAIFVSLVFFFFQFLLAKFVFLHYRGSSLALNNRRLFHICTYFLFFFNIFLGVISCLKRIIIGAVLGVMFLGRLQKSLMPRDFELKDPGFTAYIGYLYLDHTHSNAVLVTFCNALLHSLSGTHSAATSSENAAEDKEAQKRGQTSDVYHDRRRKRIRNRWALFLTLSNNPSLIEERKSEKFVHKSPLEALGVLVQDFSHLPGQVKPELRTNGVSTNASYNREAGNYEGDAMLVQTSKL